MTYEPLRVAGLFAGVGGIELGFQRQGFATRGLCEIDEAGRSVLRKQFDLPANRLWRDVTALAGLPKVDLVTAGFPCQDLSQAGRKSGISGSQSSLVDHVFRLLDKANTPSVLLENVSYMLRLDRGAAMSHLVNRFEERGYDWAYRVVDVRSFGIPQRGSGSSSSPRAKWIPRRSCMLTMRVIPSSTTASAKPTPLRRTGSTGPKGFVGLDGRRTPYPL